jgi:hypothetical protein
VMQVCCCRDVLCSNMRLSASESARRMFQPETLTVRELLQLYVDILDELRKRAIVRTANSPIGDYTEWLVAQRLNLTLSGNSTAGYDAIDTVGTRYQIKARRVHLANQSRQLSPIRNLDGQKFDYLIAVIFNSDFSIQQAAKIPHAVIAEYASYRSHVNGYILHLRGAILKDSRVKDLTTILQSQE